MTQNVFFKIGNNVDASLAISVRLATEYPLVPKSITFSAPAIGINDHPLQPDNIRIRLRGTQRWPYAVLAINCGGQIFVTSIEKSRENGFENLEMLQHYKPAAPAPSVP